MWTVYVLIILLVLASVRFVRYHDEYLSPLHCYAVKGIFICLVFVRHIREYVVALAIPISTLDRFTLIIDGNLGQLIVALFLFYSGYGLMESYKKKGHEYIKQIPKKRILATLLNFDVAVMIYFGVNYLMGRHYSLRHLVLSLFAWESVGNSSWYIFVILVCYLLFYLVFVFKKRNNPIISIGTLVILLVVFGYVLSFFKEEWWYNTLLCFWAGVSYSHFVKGRVGLIRKYYWPIIIVVTVLLSLMSLITWDVLCLKYNFFSCLFAFWVVLLTMKIQVRSKALCWMGKNLFPLYIYQRLPMILLSTYGVGALVSNSVIFTTLVFATSLIISYLHKYLDVSKYFSLNK